MPELAASAKLLGSVGERTPLQNKAPVTSHTLFLARLLTCATGIAEGYDMGCMGGVVVMLQKSMGLATWQVSSLLGVTYFAVALGSPVGGWVADNYGRRFAVVMSYVLLTAGALLMSVTVGFWELFTGRIIQACGIGVGLAAVTTYIGEVAPAAERGTYPGLHDAFIMTGVTLGYLVDVAFLGADDSWRWMLGLGGVLPAACCIFVVAGFLPESPRYLAMRGELLEAERVLRSLVGEKEATNTLRCWQAASDSQKPAEWHELLCPKFAHERRAVYAGVGIFCVQVMSGSSVIVVYTPVLLADELGAELAFRIVFVIGFVRAILTFITCWLVDIVGRRRPLILSAIGHTLAVTMLAVGYRSGNFSLKAAALVLAPAFYALGLGPVPYVYACEVLATRFRSKGMSLAILTSRLYSGTLVAVFPLFAEASSLGILFWIVVVMNVVGSTFVIACVVETAGVSLEEVPELFA